MNHYNHVICNKSHLTVSHSGKSKSILKLCLTVMTCVFDWIQDSENDRLVGLAGLELLLQMAKGFADFGEILIVVMVNQKPDVLNFFVFGKELVFHPCKINCIQNLDP